MSYGGAFDARVFVWAQAGVSLAEVMEFDAFSVIRGSTWLRPVAKSQTDRYSESFISTLDVIVILRCQLV